MSSRSIPARAGEPWGYWEHSRMTEVYPRACGGTYAIKCAPDGIQGLSPRVRGNRHRGPFEAVQPGSIPARAGEPIARVAANAKRRVYPRACGGTVVGYFAAIFQRGLSPRVRGNLRADAGTLTNIGSIPARAGEPHRS